MSLILEALRRSEAERRRGKSPDLFDGGSVAQGGARPLWPVALGGLAGGLLIAGALAWWLQSAADPALVAPPAPASPTPAPMPAPPAAPMPQATPAAPVVTAAPLPPPAAEPPAAAESPPVQTPAPAPEPEPAPTAPSAPEAAPAPAVSAARDPLLGPADGDLAVGDLAAPLRAGLPPMRLSMHVFAEDPARRFAIVDGIRLREGDTLDAGLRLREIRRDGLRLEWQGRVLWLPR